MPRYSNKATAGGLRECVVFEIRTLGSRSA